MFLHSCAFGYRYIDMMQLPITFRLTLSLLLLASGAAHAADWYVGSTGSDAPGQGASAGTPFATVGYATSAAANGDTIHIAAGSYAEPASVTVNKSLRYSGAGRASTSISRSNTGVGGGVFDLAAGASGSRFEGLTIRVADSNANLGIAAAGPISLTGLTLDQMAIVGPGAPVALVTGLHISGGASVSSLTVTNSLFTGLYYGWLTSVGDDTPIAGCGVPAANTGGSFDGITVSNTEFSQNREKGLYAEMLSNASFTAVTVRDNGAPVAGGGVSNSNGAGFDINLKAGNYRNISITQSTFTGNGAATANGGAIMVKARDDRSYTCSPATLDGVTITHNTITGNERGIRFGEPMNINVLPSVLAYNAGPTNAVVRFNQINNNVPSFNGTGNDQYGGVIDQTLSPSIHVNRNSLMGNGRGPSDLNGIVNAQVTGAPGPNNTVDGVCNWWGHASGPGESQSVYTTPSGATGSGDMVSSNVAYSLFLLSSDLNGPCASFPVAPVTAVPVPALDWRALLVMVAGLALAGMAITRPRTRP